MAPGVRQHCLSTITKLLHHSKPGILQEILKDLPISSFIGSLLGSRETSVVANALQLAEILLLKLPTTVAP